MSTHDDNPQSELTHWLNLHASELDAGGDAQHQLLSTLAKSGLFRIGVSTASGGDGQSIFAAINAIAEVARYSLTAAFVAWGHRTFIDYLVQSQNSELASRWLPQLLDGRVAGATALSNAMKYLSGIEAIQITATPDDNGWTLNGKLFWVTNLDPKGFVVAAIVQNEDTGVPAIVAIDSRSAGVNRSDNLDLVALRGSSTAALQLNSVKISENDIIHLDAGTFCPAIRPNFLGLQCGMSIGHVRASLDTISTRASRPGGDYLLAPLNRLQQQLDSHTDTLQQGLSNGSFAAQPSNLFQLRIDLAELVQQAANLELEASGGSAYLLDQHTGFERRWREAAFIPVVSPSVSQLKGELAKQAGAAQ